MACLEAFAQDNTSGEKVTVRLDTKDSISCCKFVFFGILIKLTVQCRLPLPFLVSKETLVSRTVRK
jgi:hypothetical protein